MILIEEQQNLYQEGDFLLYDLRGPDKSFLSSKLTTPYKGPYTDVPAQERHHMQARRQWFRPNLSMVHL